MVTAVRPVQVYTLILADTTGKELDHPLMKFHEFSCQPAKTDARAAASWQNRPSEFTAYLIVARNHGECLKRGREGGMACPSGRAYSFPW